MRGTTEFIIIFSGAVDIEVNDKHFIVQKSDSIHFNADTVHSYKNIGDGMATMHMTIYNP